MCDHEYKKDGDPYFPICAPYINMATMNPAWQYQNMKCMKCGHIIVDTETLDTTPLLTFDFSGN